MCMQISFIVTFNLHIISTYHRKVMESSLPVEFLYVVKKPTFRKVFSHFCNHLCKTKRSNIR